MAKSGLTQEALDLRFAGSNPAWPTRAIGEIRFNTAGF